MEFGTTKVTKHKSDLKAIEGNYKYTRKLFTFVMKANYIVYDEKFLETLFSKRLLQLKKRWNLSRSFLKAIGFVEKLCRCFSSENQLHWTEILTLIARIESSFNACEALALHADGELALLLPLGCASRGGSPEAYNIF